MVKSSIGWDALKLAISKILTLAITLIITMLLSRFRTLEEYGTYSQLILVVSLFSSIFILGLPSSINYFLARAENQNEQQEFLSVYYTLSTLLSILIGICLFALATPIAAYFKNDCLKEYIYFLALFPWSYIISLSIEHVLIVYQKTKFLIYYRLIYSLAMLAPILLVWWQNWTFSTYMQLFLSINIIFTIAIYFIVNNLCGHLDLLLNRKLIKHIFIFSLPIGFANVVSLLDAQLDKLFIGYILNTEQLAIYANASKELPLSIIAVSLTSVLLPKMTKMLKNNDNTNAVKAWKYSIEISFILISVIVFGIITFADDVITFLYSEKYLEGVNVFRIYTLILLFRCTYFGIVLNASGNTKSIFKCHLLALFLNVIFNPIFYYLFGFIGPALATIITLIPADLYLLLKTSNIININIKEMFPFKLAIQAIIINTFFAVIFYKIKYLVGLDIYVGSFCESFLLGLVWLLIHLLLFNKKLVNNWQNLNNFS